MHFLRGLVKGEQLLPGFYVEHEDADLQGVLDLVLRLPTPA